MYEEELRRVEAQLQAYKRKGVFVGRDIYLFGASMNTRQMIQILRENSIEPVNVLDNDNMRWGSYCSRIKVVSPKGLKDISNEKNLYIIFSAYWREMMAELMDGGVKKKNIILLFPKRGSLRSHILEAVKGKRLYECLAQKYGRVPVFLCPYTGTGDIYLIGTFWNQYVEANGIKDYVFLVVSRACQKTAMLFAIKNIVLLKQKTSISCLLSYDMLCPQQADIKVLNDGWPQIHTNCIEWFRGYKGLGFAELFRRFVFDLPAQARPQQPALKNEDQKIGELFRKNGLRYGKTVILSPYANTLADLPDLFWEQLARQLKQAGYSVCTNSSGKREPAVKGTACVSYPLHIAPQFVEQAGYFIGVRNGFCDIISGAKAKKIILYDGQDRFYNASAFAYFSLKGMGLCEDAVEIIFSSKKIMQSIGQIMEEISDGAVMEEQ